MMTEGMMINLIVIRTEKPDRLKVQYEQLGLTFEHQWHENGAFHCASEFAGVVLPDSARL